MSGEQDQHVGIRATPLEPPPPILYHYTRQPGLLGIVQSRSIWATKTQYLNDSKEFRHAFDVARREINELMDAAVTNTQRDFYSRVSTDFDRVRDLTYFVASMSEDRDLLSQWRAYCQPGDAFSLGFTAAQLRRRADAAGWQLVRCIYDEASQRQLIRDVVKSHELRLPTAAIAVPQAYALSQLEQLSWECVQAIARLAPRLKHSSFEEEHEWRLGSGLEDLSELKHKFRAGRFSIIPYTDFTLWDADDPPDQLTVVVGPAPDQELTMNAVTWFLAKRWPSWSVTFANNAYRDW